MKSLFFGMFFALSSLTASAEVETDDCRKYSYRAANLEAEHDGGYTEAEWIASANFWYNLCQEEGIESLLDPVFISM